jgi:nucleoside-diphosphate-sugar epimerase
MNSKKCLVTGAVGFIGQKLTKKLLETGWDVNLIMGCKHPKYVYHR